MNKLHRIAAVTALVPVISVAGAAAASAHHAVKVCDLTDNKIVEIWFSDASDLTNPTGNDPRYSLGGTVHTNVSCPAGTAGPKGDKGDTGPKGADGSMGLPGLPGVTGSGEVGPAGPAGAAGVNGKDGLNGKNGIDGKNGRAGADGTPASADTALPHTGANGGVIILLGLGIATVTAGAIIYGRGRREA